jgi:Helicase
MPVLLTDNIACELGLSNGTQGVFRELIYDDQEEPGAFNVKTDVFPSNTTYIRKPLYALVEINRSQVETNLNGLPPKLIPIPLIKKQFTVSVKQLFGNLLERMQGERETPQVIQIARTQLPIVPAFAITTDKAQGLTMNKIVVDLQVPLGTLQVASIYVPLSRVKRAEDVAILRPFDMKILQVRPSSAQDTELKRLDELDRKTQRECARLTF